MGTWSRGVRLILGVTVATAVLLASGCSPVASAPSATTVVRIPHGESVTVDVDQDWSVTVPVRAAGAVDAELTISHVGVRHQVEGTEARATADFALSTGQPLVPLTFTCHLDDPLPADRRTLLARRRRKRERLPCRARRSCEQIDWLVELVELVRVVHRRPTGRRTSRCPVRQGAGLPHRYRWRWGRQASPAPSWLTAAGSRSVRTGRHPDNAAGLGRPTTGQSVACGARPRTKVLGIGV